MLRNLWNRYYEKNREEVDDFRRLSRYFWPFRYHVAGSMACALFVSGVNGATAYLIQPVMDRVFTDKDYSILVVMCWVVMILYIAKSLFRFLQNYLIRASGERVVRDVRSQLYRHFQYLDVAYYSDTNVGVMMSRITNDVNMIQRAVAHLVSLFREPLSIISLVFVAFYMFWQGALVVFVLFPLVVWPIAAFGKRTRKWVRRGQERMGEMNSILKENFSGVRVIKAFGMEEYEIRRFERENERVLTANMKTMIFDEASNPTIEALGAFGAAGVLFVGGYLVIHGSMSVGELMSFLASLGLAYEPLKKINKMYLNFQAALAAAARVFEVIDRTPTIVDRPGAVEIDDVREGVRFEGVRFRYREEGPDVLCGIDLDVPVGQMIALVGSSGSGKTTFVNLLPRFWEPTGGRIVIDGRDIADVTLVSLRKQIGMVTQETFLFADSVKANIAYGHEDLDMDRVIDAAKAAFAHDFITQAPQGYDSPIGELGVKLSGGQRQRLAIARAIYKNAPVLILDEATSSLDTESEREVQAALERLLVGRTSFVIAHRLSTIQRADRILVLSSGRIVEDGRHQDLLTAGGEYARLYHLQFEDRSGNGE
ncbi:MAG: ABC transporter ATP-binding protein [Deltaproteobacteria bacterium]|nr:ABC transporter ATP-binding protein [Deltaproteobacteria bacterium]